MVTLFVMDTVNGESACTKGFHVDEANGQNFSEWPQKMDTTYGQNVAQMYALNRQPAWS